MDELSVKCLLYADDQEILAPSACGLQEMVNKVNDSVKKRDMKVYIGEFGRARRRCSTRRNALTNNKSPESVGERKLL
ncbi:hypothetical protein EVAR_61303_1 [Eumeta japonica]|uniref:Reverse transcriptase domain-containing protein n=1 Tax=Eumeta variegata TaxID=151549 RepID=A0A4C1XK74_EUMVA|nr:hypothetical protein EVAR_61303_1 [Eumeta japonica]